MLGDLSDPLPAALGMWERSMGPSGLSVAKAPHSIAVVLKLDPINKPEKKVIFHTAWIYKLYQHYSGLCSGINMHGGNFRT